mgnify:CR=1 FL=1
MFSRKATRIDEIFTLECQHYLVSVKLKVKISSIILALFENTNFI